ncbi:MAG: hypothetical protein K6A63_01670 [Acholeplasmatales bacterium]|nr:hypothetical protein [Acholeplasmatales bacterium]
MAKKYNYSEYPTKNPWLKPDLLYAAEYWGLHMIENMIEVDVDRYLVACKSLGQSSLLCDSLASNYKGKFIMLPKVSSYHCLYLKGEIKKLQNDWFDEYKPAFNKIKNPTDVGEDYRFNAVQGIVCMEDCDEINTEATLAAIKRIPDYRRLLNELYCMFINRVCVEFDRIILTTISKVGYNSDNFDMGKLEEFVKKKLPFEALTNYDDIRLLHRINNFLKHNSVSAYNTLKENHRNYVRCKDNDTAKIEYQNGMYALYWIILDEDYIESVFTKLIDFCDDFCHKYLNEDVANAYWMNEEYFTNKIEEMIHD